MSYFTLSVAALIPVLGLCWYIYVKDRAEKEPLWLLALLFIAGAASFIPARIGENWLVGLFDKAFSSQISYSLSGVASYQSKGAYVLHSFTRGFVAIALIEEGLKWLLLVLITFKNKHFSQLFDGIVYAVFVALGFAALENVFYAVRDGWATFVLRTVSSVPAHMTFGVVMGFCYTLWNIFSIAKMKEKELAGNGVIEVTRPFCSVILLVASFVLPLLFHGFYSFIQFFSSDVMHILFYVLLAVFYVYGFWGIYRLSKADGEENQLAMLLLKKKYPDLSKVKEDKTEVKEDQV